MMKAMIIKPTLVVKPVLIRRSRGAQPELHREAGITMVLVALAMVAIIAMAALSIDVVTLYLARMEAQRSADAGALAAARVISISGLTGDPTNSSGYWSQICGGSTGIATQAAVAAATQSTVDAVAPTVQVRYFAGGASPVPDCSSGLPAAFGVNPLVSVQVTRNNLPTFFSRIWGNAGNTVTATAVAEAFNSSNSGNVGNGTTGTITPVQPRCVKPWMVWNKDPLNPGPVQNRNYNPNNPQAGPPQFFCDQPNPSNPGGNPVPCNSLVDQGDGQIFHPGINLNGLQSDGSPSLTSTAVIGEAFWLSANCERIGSSCIPRSTKFEANYNNEFGYQQGPPNLLYLAGQAPSVNPVAVPSCSSGTSMYQQAIAGCDQSTVYHCGVQNMNTIDMSENPGGFTNDTTDGVSCLINEADPAGSQPTGQDTINLSSYPFQMLAGSSNPLVGNGLTPGTPITSSSSIVSLPIIDNTTSVPGGGTKQVTVVGFLQVFINSVDQYGNVEVTVLNVTGCSNGTGQPVGTAVTGSSPVPVRLITPP
jgi:hypothetical protein